jgi:hypothetical protein
MVRQIRCQLRKANSLRQIQCQFRKGELAETPPPPTPPHRCAEGGGAERASDGESNLIPLTLVLLGAASNPNPDLPQKAAIGGLF